VSIFKNKIKKMEMTSIVFEYFVYMGLNEIIGATRAIEGSAYWIALVVSWMQTLGSQPVIPKISLITGTRDLPKP
jgi:hypothetical protein